MHKPNITTKEKHCNVRWDSIENKKTYNADIIASFEIKISDTSLGVFMVA